MTRASQLPIRKSQRTAVIISREKHRRLSKEPTAQRANDHMEREFENNGILSLNDDCLLAIMSLLSIEDLFAAKQCGNRLSALADVAAPKRCRRQSFRYLYNYEAHRNMVECYGKFMQNVTFERKLDEIARLGDNGSQSPELKWMWLRRCTALRALTIRNMAPFYDRDSVEIYERLQSLEIEKCLGHEDTYVRIIEACANLKSIKVSKFTIATFNCIARLQNIERIVLRDSRCDIFAYHMTALQGLKKLKHLGMDFRFRGCVGVVPVIMALNRFASLIRFDLHLASIPEKFANALNRLENIQICQLHFDQSTPLDENVFADRISNFRISANRGCSECDYICHDVELQRKN